MVTLKQFLVEENKSIISFNEIQNDLDKALDKSI
jgi:hypothetical protein